MNALAEAEGKPPVNVSAAIAADHADTAVQLAAQGKQLVVAYT